jgi:hypothetical protein
MMRGGIAVVSGAVVQRRDLARLANRAQRLQRAMHGGERDIRMFLADLGEDGFGAWMVARVNQHAHHSDALRRNRQPAVAASGGELGQPFGGIPGAPLGAYQRWTIHIT